MGGNEVGGDGVSISRQKTILKLRARGLTDGRIGALMGISRQRVGQLLPSGAVGRPATPEFKESRILAIRGLKRREIADMVGVSVWTVGRVLKEAVRQAGAL